MTNKDFRDLDVAHKIDALDNNEVVAMVACGCTSSNDNSANEPQVIGYTGPQIDQQPIDVEQRDKDVAKQLGRTVIVQQIITNNNYNTTMFVDGYKALCNAGFTPAQSEALVAIFAGTCSRIANKYYTKVESDERFAPITANA